MYDAVNLARLYNAFLKDKEIVLNQYCKLLSKSKIGPEPVTDAIRKLLNGEPVTPEEFMDLLRNYIQ